MNDKNLYKPKSFTFIDFFDVLRSFYFDEIDNFTFNAYYHALKGYSMVQIKKALIDYVSDPHKCGLCPKPNDIIDKIINPHKDE